MSAKAVVRQALEGVNPKGGSSSPQVKRLLATQGLLDGQKPGRRCHLRFARVSESGGQAANVRRVLYLRERMCNRPGGESSEGENPRSAVGMK